MGGMTAALTANQMVADIRAVILADPTFLSPERQREVHESDARQLHSRLLTSTKSDVMTQLRRRHPNRSPEIVELLAEARLETRIQAFDVLTPPNPEYRALISTIDVPILLVIADNGVVSLETARKLQHLNPRLVVEQIQDASHGLPYDQPDRFAEVVRWFLQSIALS
jgi:pimeloyl-ACP methyl ester carboxylesterase